MAGSDRASRSRRTAFSLARVPFGRSELDAACGCGHADGSHCLGDTTADLTPLNGILGYVVTSVVTADMVWSLFLLIAAIPAHKELPRDMLRSAAALWITNVLVFASWYWRLDAGGPRERERRGVHTDGAFLFPQMTLDQQAKREMGEDRWSPGFIDYLFLAFNISTAFSPVRFAGSIALGQIIDDGPGPHLIYDCGLTRG